MVSSSVIQINNKICLTELWRGLHKLMHLKCLEQKRAWYIIQKENYYYFCCCLSSLH